MLVPLALALALPACGGGGGGSGGSSGGSVGDCSPSAAGTWLVTTTILSSSGTNPGIWPGSVSAQLNYVGSIDMGPSLHICAYSFVGSELDTKAGPGEGTSLSASRSEGTPDPAPFDLGGMWYYPATDTSVSAESLGLADSSTFTENTFTVEESFLAYAGDVIVEVPEGGGVFSYEIDPAAVSIFSGTVRFTGVRIQPSTAESQAPEGLILSGIGAWELGALEERPQITARLDSKQQSLELIVSLPATMQREQRELVFRLPVAPDGTILGQTDQASLRAQIDSSAHLSGILMLRDRRAAPLAGPFDMPLIRSYD